MIDPQVLERHGLKPDEYERIVRFWAGSRT